MNEKILVTFINPVKMKIFYEVSLLKQATAKELASKTPDIPQATLYRHLKKMTEDGVLIVAKERPIRNITEKIYEIAPDLDKDVQKIVSENDGLGYFLLFQQYMFGLQAEFGQRENINITEDGSGFHVAPFYATSKEVQELARKIVDVIKPYMENQPTMERQLRNIGMIYTPPKNN